MPESVIGTKADNPIWMAFVPRKPTLKEFLFITSVSILPVAMAILMQKPALRQAIVMKSLHMTKVTCQEIADAFQYVATKSAQEYQKASM